MLETTTRHKATTTQAVIYARVSSTKQTTKGDGLSSQTTRCREFAKYKGYAVAEVFKDDMTGGAVDRPGMKAMLAFLRKHRSNPHVVIIDDISRLARGLEAHLKLRAAISAAGGLLESPSIEFGEDSDSQLVENLLASVSQHQRQKNSEQVKNRMRARMMNGFWVFQAPFGLRYARSAGRGKVMVPDEPAASLVREALTGYACGRFATQGEVGRFLEASPLYPYKKDGFVHSQRVCDLLTSPLYAGLIEHAPWGIALQPGQHQGLVDVSTYQRIQERRRASAVAPARKNLDADFALRGFVVCADCGGALTAAWSKGRSAHYGYYFCQRRGCPSRKKSIPKARIEGDFEAVLQDLQPTAQLFRFAFRMLETAWNKRVASAGKLARQVGEEIAKVERKLAQLLDRIVEAENPRVVAVYEERVSALSAEKLALAEKAERCEAPGLAFEQTYRTAMAFLANPWNIWSSGDLVHRRLVLRLTFARKLAYCRNTGYRTAEMSLPFKVLRDIAESAKLMVEPSGIEPLTS